MTQDQALAILKTGANVFLTGEPGSGKTHTINLFVAWLKERDIESAVTASTGIAATHINGHTIHSWSGIGVKRELTKYDLASIVGNKRVANRVRNLPILIIDEISMLSAQTFSMVEKVCRTIRGSTESFGGLQVVLVGDFFQLPPIAERVFSEEGLDLIRQKKSNEFAFNSLAWSALNPTVCYLSEQYRQDDQLFLELLSSIRSGTVSQQHRALLEGRITRKATEGVTQFLAHNADVDRVNNIKLSQLPDEAHIFAMQSHGPKPLVERLKRGCLSPEALALKINSRVMFTKNDINRHRFVNGTLGIIIGFSKEEGKPIVKTHAGHTVFAEPAEWSIEENGRTLARVTQVPLRLAWAITVHKSQGMSLDSAHIDLSNAFEYGQGYVAISRVRTLAGLTLAGFNERSLEVHPDIAIQDIQFRNASSEAQKNIKNISIPEISTPEIINQRKQKYPGFSCDVTKELLLQKLSLKDIAKERGVTVGTIISHLEKLVVDKKINPRRDLDHLKIEKARFEKIELVFKEVRRKTSDVRLSSVREILGDSFSFDELRLARLFLSP